MGLPGQNDAGTPTDERISTRSISYDRPETEYDRAHATERDGDDGSGNRRSHNILSPLHDSCKPNHVNTMVIMFFFLRCEWTPFQAVAV